LALARPLGFNDGGDEDGESDCEHADGLVLDSLDLIDSDFSIPEVSDDGREA